MVLDWARASFCLVLFQCRRRYGGILSFFSHKISAGPPISQNIRDRLLPPVPSYIRYSTSRIRFLMLALDRTPNSHYRVPKLPRILRNYRRSTRHIKEQRSTCSGLPSHLGDLLLYIRYTFDRVVNIRYPIHPNVFQ